LAEPSQYSGASQTPAALRHSVPAGLAGLLHKPVMASQTPASWQMSAAMHTTALVPKQVPPWQESVCVHKSPSSQVPPSAIARWVHSPVAGAHSSSVHGLASLQLRAEPPWQEPSRHVSPVVHASSSVQVAALAKNTQPATTSQLSSVHGLASSHTIGAPAMHAEFWQLSPVVQASPSSQPDVFGACSQPLAGLHRSDVHGLASSQSTAFIPAQAPSRHASPVVQTFPSSHAALLAVLAQPVATLQESSVHGLESEQLSPTPAHTPSAHPSITVQALPSSQPMPLATCSQPVAGLQASCVQGFASLQSGLAPARQLPLLQTSPPVHALPSSQLTVFGACTHPLAALQLSSVHKLLSSQSIGAPPTHAPAVHVSPPVQALPSLQTVPVLSVCVHPVAGEQPSTVHALSSLQSTLAPGVHALAWQTSPAVQGFASSHCAVLPACTQPVAAEQLSTVHVFASSHVAVMSPCWQPSPASQVSEVQALSSLQPVTAPLRHTPPLQASSTVHALPSEQATVLTPCVHPVAGLHASSVQTLASSQSLVRPAQTAWPLHTSPIVQALPSSQNAAIPVWMQPLAATQISKVQTLLSSQGVTAPGMQIPPLHVSPTVQSLPSLHAAVWGVPTHPKTASQVSSVHGLLSLHCAAPGTCTQAPPDAQLSAVQSQPSLQPLTHSSLLQSEGQVATVSPNPAHTLHTPSPQ